MRREETVYILDGITRQPVEARLVEGLTRAEVTLAGAEWRPFLQQILLTLQKQGAETPEHSHWDWARKAASAAADSLFFGIERDNQMQGMMIAIPRRPSRLMPGESLVYVDYVSAAPWNLSHATSPRRFLQIGTGLLHGAIRFSMRSGFEGRIGLHSLPQATEFYQRSLRMTDLGTDAAYYYLRYFEMDADQAQEQLGLI